VGPERYRQASLIVHYSHLKVGHLLRRAILRNTQYRATSAAALSVVEYALRRCNNSVLGGNAPFSNFRHRVDPAPFPKADLLIVQISAAPDHSKSSFPVRNTNMANE